MKKINLLSALMLMCFGSIVSAATLEWNAVNVTSTNGSFIQAVEVDPQHLTGQVSFVQGDSALGLKTDTWTYKLNGDEVVDHVAIEFDDLDMDVESVFLDGIALSDSAANGVRRWEWSGALLSGLHTLTISNIDVKNDFGQYQLKVSTVPVPAAVWLFGSALMGLVGMSRRKSGSMLSA